MSGWISSTSASDPRAKAWVNLVGVIFFLLPGCIMVIVTSFKFVYDSWAILEGSPDPGGIPFRFIVKGTITVGFFLLSSRHLSRDPQSPADIGGGKDEEVKP